MENNFSPFQLQALPISWPSYEEGFGHDVSVSSSKSHSEAEKRRRDRINGHLQTLRKLTPKSEKMDKAALLANVIRYVKELKTKADALRQSLTVPSDIDELHISHAQKNIFKVSMCCEDRPGLFQELDKALQSLKLLIFQAEMATVGCRVQMVLLLSSNNLSNDEDLGLISLRGKLRASLNMIVNSTPSVSSYRVVSKRQQFFFQQG